jgi:hypothetical protein
MSQTVGGAEDFPSAILVEAQTIVRTGPYALAID